MRTYTQLFRANLNNPLRSLSSVMITRLMLNLRDPNLFQGPLHSMSISGLVFRNRRATSTQLDFHSQEPEFSQRTGHENIRCSVEPENHDLSRSAGMYYRYGIFIVEIMSTYSAR